MVLSFPLTSHLADIPWEINLKPGFSNKLFAGVAVIQSMIKMEIGINKSGTCSCRINDPYTDNIKKKKMVAIADSKLITQHIHLL